MDALIAGADPVAAKKVQSPEAKKQTSPKKVVKPKKAPWEDLPNEGRVNMPLYVTPQIKGMLDFLKEETSVPTQVDLRKLIEPELRKKAEKIWKEKQ